MTTLQKQAQRLETEFVERAAQRAVARAVEARQAAGVELSAADVAQVAGGALLLPVIRAGGIPVNPFATKGIGNQQIVTPAGLAI